MRKDYDIVGSYNNQRISAIDSERTVNCFEYIDKDGKRPKSLIFTSGLRNTNLNFFSETGGSRASFVYKDAIYQVYGGTVFRIQGNTGSLSRIVLGYLSTNSGYVGIDANTFQVIFVDGTAGYIWDTNANTFTQITDSSFPSRPIDVTYLDGFFVVANGETNNFQLSSFDQGMVWGTGSITFLPAAVNTTTDTITLSSTVNFATGVPITFSTTTTLPSPLNNSTTYYSIRVSSTEIAVATSYENAIANIKIDLTTQGTGDHTVTLVGQLQQGSITSHPGNIVACRTLHRRLFLFSENYTEVWENAGIGTNLPFRRNNSLLMEVGTPAIGSVSVGFDRLFFLSRDRDGLGSVMEVKGSEAVPVSNRALDYQLAQYAARSTNGITHVADARGILIKENGLIFYRLNFTEADHTFVLNVTMSSEDSPKWHEEEILNGARHPAQTHAFYKGVNYYGHYARPIFYIVDPNVCTNDGEAIKRMRIGKPIAPEGYNRLRIDRFQLDLLQGNEAFVLSDENYRIIDSGFSRITDSGDLRLLEQQGLEPQGAPVVFLSISKDGGQSYGYRIRGTMGRLGQRTFRTVYRKLGTIPRGQAFIPKFEFFSEVPFVVLGAAWDFEVLPE